MSRESLDDLRKKLGLEAQAHQAAVDAVDAAAAAYLQVNRIDLRCLEILTQNDSVLPSQLAVRSHNRQCDRNAGPCGATRLHDTVSRSGRPPQSRHTNHPKSDTEGNE